jgi:thiamine pyrophosphokinase
LRNKISKNNKGECAAVPDRLCVIIGAGDEGDIGALGGLAEPGAFIICADGGFRACRKAGLLPDLLIGDFDSISDMRDIPGSVELVALSPDKNYTDSWHAAEEGLGRGFRRFLLFGMLGGRLDHTLANLGLLAWLKERGAEALLTDGSTEARALTGSGSITLPNRPGCYFSLLALSPCEGVAVAGAKYSLSDYPLTATDQRAVSNEFAGRRVTVSQRAGVLIVMSAPGRTL